MHTNIPRKIQCPARQKYGRRLRFEPLEHRRLLSVTGDYNANGVVDAADYVVWRKSVGLTGTQAADGNNDHLVDQLDYDVWRQHAGDQLPLPGTFSITPLSLPDADGNFTISWQPSANAQNYQFQFSLHSDGSSPYYSTVTTATSQAFSNFPEGTLFVGITAMNSAGTTPATNTNNEVVIDFPTTAQVIYVTTKNYAVDTTDFNPPRFSTFGSPHGADYHTTDDASLAGLLSSTWDHSTIIFRAMLTQPGSDLFLRANILDGIFINTHGDIIATGRNQLYAGPHTAPILDQNGNAVADNLPVWTGSTADGLYSGFTAGGWMDSFSGATVGRTNGSGTTWLSNDVRIGTTASRLYGIGAISATNLTIHSSPLTLTTPIADQIIAAATPFNLNVASDFAAGSDPLTFYARQTSGVAIPAWLSFDSITGTFTGTSPAGTPATFNIEVVARNELSTATVTDQFQLTVTAAGSGAIASGSGLSSQLSTQQPRTLPAIIAYPMEPGPATNERKKSLRTPTPVREFDAAAPQFLTMADRRDDALVAWLASRSNGREQEAADTFAAVREHVVVDEIDNAFDGLRTSFHVLKELIHLT